MLSALRKMSCFMHAGFISHAFPCLELPVLFRDAHPFQGEEKPFFLVYKCHLCCKALIRTVNGRNVIIFQGKKYFP